MDETCLRSLHLISGDEREEDDEALLPRDFVPLHSNHHQPITLQNSLELASYVRQSTAKESG